MSSWIIRNSAAGLDPNNRFYWNTAYNPGAYFYEWYPYQGAPGAVYCNTYNLALPNCTTYAYARVQEGGAPYPITDFHNASAWHSYVTNGWTAVPYTYSNVEPGDILEWASNHVAVVEKVAGGVIYVSESAYTDDNGGVNGDRTDSVWGTTKTSVYNKGTGTWPNRFFHYGQTIYAAGNPSYILKNPIDYSGTNNKIFIVNKKQRRRRILYV